MLCLLLDIPTLHPTQQQYRYPVAPRCWRRSANCCHPGSSTSYSSGPPPLQVPEPASFGPDVQVSYQPQSQSQSPPLSTLAKDIKGHQLQAAPKARLKTPGRAIQYKEAITGKKKGGQQPKIEENTWRGSDSSL